MKGQVTENIRVYMNSRSTREYSYYEVSAIAGAIGVEYNNRKQSGRVINGKTEEGRLLINQRVAAIANEKLGTNLLNAEAVRLYKRCFAAEYTERTGRCAWGFKEVRRRLGFDENTGYEIMEEEVV